MFHNFHYKSLDKLVNFLKKFTFLVIHTHQSVVLNPIKSLNHRILVILTYFNTMVAHRTVWTSRRTIEFTRNTPLHSHCDAIYFGVFVEWSSELIFTIFVWGSCKQKRNSEKKKKTSWDNKVIFQLFCNFCLLDLAKWLCLPFGITPGSINVASEKFAITKKVITPWIAGTQNCLWFQ